MKNIVLIGFASCGKSAVGMELANVMGMDFVDLDDRVRDAAHGKFDEELSCREIYQKFGEDTFRQLETDALRMLLICTDTVIATGGGAPLRTANQLLLTELGTVVYLKSSPGLIFRRMQDKGMPAYLRDDPTLENLTRAVDERDPIYQQVAGLVIDRSTLDIDATVRQIRKRLDEIA